MVQVVDSQDLELLETLKPWVERARLSDHPEGMDVVHLGSGASEYRRHRMRCIKSLGFVWRSSAARRQLCSLRSMRLLG